MELTKFHLMNQTALNAKGFLINTHTLLKVNYSLSINNALEW